MQRTQRGQDAMSQRRTTGTSLTRSWLFQHQGNNAALADLLAVDFVEGECNSPRVFVCIVRKLQRNHVAGNIATVNAATYMDIHQAPFSTLVQFEPDR